MAVVHWEGTSLAILLIASFLFGIVEPNDESLQSCVYVEGQQMPEKDCNRLIIEKPIEDWALPSKDLEINFKDKGDFDFEKMSYETKNQIFKITIINAQNVDLDLKEFNFLLDLDLQNIQLRHPDSEFGLPKGLQRVTIKNASLSKLDFTESQEILILDLTNNNFDTIPSISSLRELRLKKNQLTEIVSPICSKMTKLYNLDLSWNKIQEITENTFSCILPRNFETPQQLEINLSHNQINTIHLYGFHGLKIKWLDLSNNLLKRVDSSLLSWRSLQYLNIQENPWTCECADQWMVDTLVPHLYENPEQLYNLKCSSPTIFKDQLMVSFLNHVNPFCKYNQTRIIVTKDIFEVDQVYEMWTGSLISCIVLSVVIALLLVAILLAWLLPRRKRQRAERPRSFYDRLGKDENMFK